MSETAVDARQKARQYLASETNAKDTPRISQNKDVWLQETVAILSETSIEMVHLMAKSPENVAPFIRIFSLVTNLAADSKKMLQQQAAKPPNGPPVAPPSASGDNGGMERRIDGLEKDMKDVRDRLVRIETKLDEKAEKSDILKTEVKLILLGASAWASLLFVLAKGFKWF